MSRRKRSAIDKRRSELMVELIDKKMDLPRDILLDIIEVLRYGIKGVKVRNGIMQTKTELVLEQTHQGSSDEVLILWGIVTQSNIDYAERIWEEFTQSIHTFIEDKRNLSRHTTRKKRATLIVIPSIRLTKLIVHHLQRRHKFHLRPDSPIHLPNEEPILGYLKFSAKGSKREVFGIPIPENIWPVKQRGHLESPAPMPTKPARKPKSTAPKVPPRPSVSIPVTSAQPAPISAPAKPQEKKHKQATETSDKPPKAKKSKYGWVTAEDAELQKVLEENMKTAYAALPRDSEEESEKVMLGATKGGNDEDQAGPDPGAQAEGQTGTDAGTLDEGQAGSNPDEISEGQAGLDPGNAGDKEQSIPSLVAYDGSDREHMDLDVADVSPQPLTKQLDERFTATAYQKVQENLKLAVEEHVLLEDPASSSGTLSSPQHLSRDISFGDQFFSDKPSDADKNAKIEVESMVNVPIQQALSSIYLMISPIIDLTSRPESPMRIGELEHIMANLIQVNTDMKERLDNHGAHLYMLEQLDIHQQVSIARMWETESYKTHEDHTQLFEALEKLMNRDHSEELAQDLAEAWITGVPSACVIFELSLRSSSTVRLLIILVVEYSHLRAITELVYLVEAYHHLNPIFIPKYDSPKRINNGKCMLVLEACGIPLRFSEVQLSLVALNPKLEVFYALSYNQLSGLLVDGHS
nr:hypothetical protein [Tanacetum cinerariifolium]